MSPILKEIRKLINKINKIDKNVFPIQIKGGIYAKPLGTFFKRKEMWKMWNFISGKFGYLSSHCKYPENGIGYCGCPVSDFDDNVKLEVRNILQNKLNELKGKNNV